MARLKGTRDVQFIWEPSVRPGLEYTTDGPERVGHHKTVTDGGTGRSLYGASGYWPQLTIGPGVIRQHLDTEVGGYALENDKGGVETNRLGVVQLEIIGRPGVTMGKTTADTLICTLKQLEDLHGIPWAWPNGRPVKAREIRPGVFVDAGGHNRSTAGWLRPGHFDHGSIPENAHWDTAYTDLEWLVLNQAMAPQATAEVLTTWKVRPMFDPAVPVVDALATEDGDGCWLLAADGAIYTTGAAPWLGGMNDERNRKDFAGRTAARLERHGVGGYRIVATSGEKYVPAR